MRRLDEEVPTVLAREQDRPVGAPGRATYTVQRGAFELGLEKDRLALSVPISATISVCKPFGSACLRYGACRPSFEVHFGLSTEVSADYRIEPPHGSLSATRRCVIGLDVTERLEAIARKELSGVQAQIAQRWPDTSNEIAGAWKELSNPLRVTPMDCVLFDGTDVLYEAPHFIRKGKKVAAALAVSGTIRPANSCNQEHEAGALPAPTRVDKVSATSELWVPELLALSRLKRALKRKLVAPSGELSVAEVHVGGAHVTALLVLQGKGRSCEAMWLKARVGHERGKGLLLRSPELRLPDRTRLNLQQQQELLEHLTQIPLLRTEGDAWTSPERVEALLDQLHGKTPQGMRLGLSTKKPRTSRVQITTEGVLVLHSARPRLRIKDI